MNDSIRQHLGNRKRQILGRLDKSKLGDCSKPVFSAANIHYDVSKRVRGLAFGGIGAFHLLARRIGLIDAIDKGLHLLKIAMPYHESDHVLNIAYNPLCNGDCLQDIELRRNNAVFLDALGARRIPDPTTAGDFCRRFDADSINTLQDIFDDVRIGVWKRQPPRFFEQAIIDADGSQVETTGQCKAGMDIGYNGAWGYHPLIVSLANTREVLRIVNRSGNRPSHEGAADALDRAIATCRRGGFQKILLRGDTDFSQTQHLDRWDKDGIRFLFGYDCKSNLKALGESLPDRLWRRLKRPGRPTPKTPPRQRPDNVKDRIVRERGFETLRLQWEDIADWDYRPLACKQAYRLIILRKNISKEKGELRLFDEIRYFFYLTNDWQSEAEQIVLAHDPHDRATDANSNGNGNGNGNAEEAGESPSPPSAYAHWVEPTNGANGRCHQENLIQQLKSGMHALKAPVDNLESNWAYMVMTSLAWNLKSWSALMLPEKPGRWQEKHRAEKAWLIGLEFKAFINAVVAIPCQIALQARRIVFRVLDYSPHHALFFRLVDALRC